MLIGALVAIDQDQSVQTLGFKMKRVACLLTIFLGMSQMMGCGNGTTETLEGQSAAVVPEKPVREYLGKLSDRFPDILLRTQDNKPVYFYSDLIKDRTVIINFMYTTCDGI